MSEKRSALTSFVKTQKVEKKRTIIKATLEITEDVLMAGGERGENLVYVPAWFARSAQQDILSWNIFYIVPVTRSVT